MPPWTRVAFDANGLRYLCEDEPLHRAARLRLRHLVKHGEIRVMGGWALVLELSCMAEHDWTGFTRQTRELRLLTDGRLLKQWDDRVLLEARRGGLLPDREAWLPAGASRGYFERMLSDPGVSKHEAGVARRAKEKYAAGETEAKLEYRTNAAKLDAENGGDVARSWTNRLLLAAATTSRRRTKDLHLAPTGDLSGPAANRLGRALGPEQGATRRTETPRTGAYLAAAPPPSEGQARTAALRMAAFRT